jgi:hypothetical protein
MQKTNVYSSVLWEKLTVVVISIGIVTLLGYLVLRNTPFADPNLVVITRILLSLAVAILGATIPGFLQIDWKKQGFAIRAGGALALFIVTFLLSPNVVNKEMNEPTKSINVGLKMANDDNDGKLFIDKVDILSNMPEVNQRKLSFQVALRNPGAQTINATGFIFRFDRELKEGRLPQDVRDVTGIYVVKLDKNQATTDGPVGKFFIKSWYPSQESRKLIVSGPISQFLSAKTTDKIQFTVEFDASLELKGPMTSIVVGIVYNDKELAESESIPISLQFLSK